MKRKEYKLGSEGREAMKNVATLINKILGNTLGPAGRDYFLPSGITNDGRTIVSEIRFEDECEDNVALAFHEVASRTDKDAGDGTTSAMVLASQLVLDLVDKVGDIDTPIPSQKSVVELSRQLEEEKNKALELLKDKVIPIKTIEDLERVAFTSMEDKEGAKIITEAMWEAGKDSYPVLKEGFNEKIEKDVINGVDFPLNIAVTTMFNKVGKAEYDDIAVLVVNHAFEQYIELASFFTSMLKSPVKPRALLIVAKNYSVPFINSVSDVSRRTGFPIVLVSANVHNDTFEDIAAYVDAKMTDTHPKTGKKISEVKFEDVGYCKTVIAREKNTQFIGGRGLDAIVLNKLGATNRIGQRVEEIKELLAKETSPDERNQMERRMAALLGGIVTIYVDAKTAVERHRLKLKAEDAMNSCRAALNGGMVKGGGESLDEIADKMGIDCLLYNTLKHPKQRILSNNLAQPLDTDGVYDAYNVVKAGLENAVSVVKTLLTIEGIISDAPRDLVGELKDKLRE